MWACATFPQYLTYYPTYRHTINPAIIKNTTSASPSTSGKRPAPSEPPRPRVKRRKGLNAMTDVDVWGSSDEEIISVYLSFKLAGFICWILDNLGAAKETWRSSAYDHYVPHLERCLSATGEPERLVIHFICKYKSPDHLPQKRERLRSGMGPRTFSLRRRGVVIGSGMQHLDACSSGQN